MRRKIKVTTILWEFRETGWFKYSTGGASKENLGSISWEFSLRELHGDLIHAEGTIIEDTNKMEAEDMEILHASIHCNDLQQDKVIIQTYSLAIQKNLNKE